LPKSSWQKKVGGGGYQENERGRCGFGTERSLRGGRKKTAERPLQVKKDKKGERGRPGRFSCPSRDATGIERCIKSRGNKGKNASWETKRGEEEGMKEGKIRLHLYRVRAKRHRKNNDEGRSRWKDEQEKMRPINQRKKGTGTTREQKQFLRESIKKTCGEDGNIEWGWSRRKS